MYIISKGKKDIDKHTVREVASGNNNVRYNKWGGGSKTVKCR